MKSTELKVGVKYAVIPSWDYSSADKKDASRVERRYVAKAELVSDEKYEYKVFRFDSPNNPNFQPAPKGSRSVGYMVKSLDWAGSTGQVTYWLARAQDIVAEYAPLEVRWNKEEAEAKAHEAKARAEREDAERARADAQAYAERSLESVMGSLKSIIGDRVTNVRSDINSRRDANGNYIPVPEVTFDIRTLQLLIEKVLEARDMVA